MSDRWRSVVEHVAVALGATAVVSLFLAIVPGGFTAESAPDFRYFYAPAARSLVAGEGLTIHGAALEGFPPLFPWLLAATFAVAGWVGASEATALLVLTVGCLALATVSIYALARRLWGRRGGLLAAACFLTYPPILWLARQPMSELPFLTLLYLALGLCWAAVRRAEPRPELALACGVLAGLAALTRSIALGLGFALAFAVGWLGRRHGSRMAIVLATAVLVGQAAVTMPWHLWLEARTGRFFGSGAVHAMEDGLTFTARSKGYREGTWAPKAARQAMETLDRRLAGVRSVGGIVEEVTRLAAEQPRQVATLYAFKAARIVYGTDSQRFEVPLLVVNLTWLGLLGAAAVRCIERGGPVATWARIVLVAIGFFWLATLVGAPLMRYVTPVWALGATLLPALSRSRPGASR